MTRKTDIEALLERANKEVLKIIEEYNKSLHDKTIGIDLKIDIKNYFNNLRSILDYLAHDIVEKYCPNTNTEDRPYFPISPNQNSFEGIMKKSYPNLSKNYTKIYDVLENIQPYKKPENIWLSSFNKVNNENKHDKLTPQKRIETKRINVSINDGGSVSWNSDAVKFGSGVFIGGVPVNPNTQMPQHSLTQTITIETWVDFQFEDIGISAITLIKESLNGIKTIFSNLQNYI